MRVTWDRECDMAYIYLTDARAPGSVAETVDCEGSNSAVYVDFDASGVMLGIEVPRASEVLPRAVLDQSVPPGNGFDTCHTEN